MGLNAHTPGARVDCRRLKGPSQGSGEMDRMGRISLGCMTDFVAQGCQELAFIIGRTIHPIQRSPPPFQS
jgi:hypothetical protein